MFLVLFYLPGHLLCHVEHVVDEVVTLDGLCVFGHVLTGM